jgi:hypothetical protein
VVYIWCVHVWCVCGVCMECAWGVRRVCACGVCVYMCGLCVCGGCVVYMCGVCVVDVSCVVVHGLWSVCVWLCLEVHACALGSSVITHVAFVTVVSSRWTDPVIIMGCAPSSLERLLSRSLANVSPANLVRTPGLTFNPLVSFFFRLFFNAVSASDYVQVFFF